jgi:hypothetical protein
MSTNEIGDTMDIELGRYGAIQEQDGWFCIYGNYDCRGYTRIGLLGPDKFYPAPSIQKVLSMELITFLANLSLPNPEAPIPTKTKKRV